MERLVLELPSAADQDPGQTDPDLTLAAWNWHQPGRPTLVARDRAELEAGERQFLVSEGVLVGTVKHLENDEQISLRPDR